MMQYLSCHWQLLVAIDVERRMMLSFPLLPLPLLALRICVRMEDVVWKSQEVMKRPLRDEAHAPPRRFCQKMEGYRVRSTEYGGTYRQYSSYFFLFLGSLFPVSPPPPLAVPITFQVSTLYYGYIVLALTGEVRHLGPKSGQPTQGRDESMHVPASAASADCLGTLHYLTSAPCLTYPALSGRTV